MGKVSVSGDTTISHSNDPACAKSYLKMIANISSSSELAMSHKETTIRHDEIGFRGLQYGSIISNQGYQFLFFCWCLFLFSTPFVGLRLYVQSRFRRRPWHEIFLVLAWVSHLGDTVCQTLQFRWTTALGPDDNMKAVLKTVIAAAFLHKTVLYCCKTVLLSFYAEITPRSTHTKIWVTVVSTYVLIGMGEASQIFNTAGAFASLKPKFSAPPGFTSFLEIASWAFHFLTHVPVYVIPFVILQTLRNLTTKQRRAAYTMFAVGFLNIIPAVYLLIYVCMSSSRMKLSPKLRHNLDAAAAWLTALEEGSAIIIVCLPHCRRLWLGISAEAMRPELRSLNLNDAREIIDMKITRTPTQPNGVLLPPRKLSVPEVRITVNPVHRLTL